MDVCYDNFKKTMEKKGIFLETKPLIVAIDDEPDIVELLSLNLTKAGFDVRTFGLAKGLLIFLEKNRPDLLILDLMLPDGDGLEICKKIRQTPRLADLPILMLTAKGEELDVVLGLELGADDYMVKPFSPKELVARIKAVLRRSQLKPLEEKAIIRIGQILEIDSNQHEVKVNGEKVTLTTTEFTILKILCLRPGWVYSRERLLDLLWGDDKAVIDRTIDVHIKNLREKLGPAAKIVKNIRGIGYKIEV